MKDQIAPFAIEPGINRDLPKFASRSYLDGQHVRFDKGRPRKMGGYKLLVRGTNLIVRSLANVELTDKTRVFMFRNDGIYQVDIDANGSAGGEVDRTPESFVNTQDLCWSVATITVTDEGIISDYIDRIGGRDQILRDDITQIPFIFAVGMPNASNVAQNVPGQIYYGAVQSDAPFIPIVDQKTAGGIIVSSPFLLKYGSDGVIYWSAPDNPTSWPLENYLVITSDKILGAKLNRGGMVMWSLTELIQVNYDSALETFTKFTIDPNISLLAPNSIVSIHNELFWIGNEQFYRYNGVVNENPNELNRNFFYENVNRNHLGKIWGMYLEKFSEIWWFWPDKQHTECNRAIIYNLRDQSWYDTEMPRASGTSSPILGPLMSDSEGSDLFDFRRFGIWQHEVGYNREEWGAQFPIKSYFQTNLISIFKGNPELNVQFRTRRIELDIIQRGEMYLEVMDYSFPKASPIISQAVTFSEGATHVDLKEMGRYVSYRYTSNTVDGFYQLGDPLINFQPGTVRPTTG